MADLTAWRPVERPVGPQVIPAWCLGAHVDWNEGYGNAPDVRLKVRGDVRDWPDKRFRKNGGFYRAEHADGRLEQYAHRGPIGLALVQMFRSADGSLRQHRRSGPEWASFGICVGLRYGVPVGFEPGEFVEVSRSATSQQEGFCGAHVHIVMEDGSDLVLRGPWHTIGPEGFVEVSYTDVEKDRARSGPWWRTGGRAGLYIRNDLFLRIMARFNAHVPIAEVVYGWRDGPVLEPYREEWEAPKRLRGAAHG